MRTGLKNLLKAVCFLIVLGVVILSVQEVVVPYRDWPSKGRRTTKTVRSVFNEQKDSLDVLWLGTSHVFSAISPMELYRQTNIYSYVLGIVGERAPVAYYLAQAALREQTPKLVIVDVGVFFHSDADNKNTGAWQGALDALPITRMADRVAMAKGLAETRDEPFDEGYIARSVLPILLYHDNYTAGVEEYLNLHTDQLYPRKGFVCTTGIKASKATPVDPAAEPQTNTVEFQELLERFNTNLPTANALKKLCDDHGVELVFTKMPVCARKSYDGRWSVEKHMLAQSLADEMGIEFIDLNYQDVDIDWNTDTRDGGMHLNLAGAVKATSFLGEWLSEHYDFGPHDDEKLKGQWDAQLKLYDSEMEYAWDQMEDDIVAFLDAVVGDDVTLLTTVSGGVGEFWTDEIQAKFTEATGIENDLRNASNAAFAAVSFNGELIGKKSGDSKCSLSATLPDGESCKLTSKAVDDAEGEGKIEVEGTQMASSGRGIHFAVYDNRLKCVVDSVTFGPSEKGGVQMTRDNDAYEWEYYLELMENAAEYMKTV